MQFTDETMHLADHFQPAPIQTDTRGGYFKAFSRRRNSSAWSCRGAPAWFDSGDNDIAFEVCPDVVVFFMRLIRINPRVETGNHMSGLGATVIAHFNQMTSGEQGSIKAILPEICRYWEFVNLCFAGG